MIGKKHVPLRLPGRQPSFFLALSPENCQESAAMDFLFQTCFLIA
jgi:hypothetical protein